MKGRIGLLLFKRNSGRDFKSNLGSLFELFFFPLMFIISNPLHSIRIWNFLITDVNLIKLRWPKNKSLYETFLTY